MVRACTWRLINGRIRGQIIPFKRRFNYRLAIDREIQNLEPNLENYETFVKKVNKISRKYISMGCRQNYIPGLNRESCKAKAKNEELFKQNPFSEETIIEGEKLTQLLYAEKNRKWHETIENIDITKNSKKA